MTSPESALHVEVVDDEIVVSLPGVAILISLLHSLQLRKPR
jgi:hypothetical protein